MEPWHLANLRDRGQPARRHFYSYVASSKHEASEASDLDSHSGQGLDWMECCNASALVSRLRGDIFLLLSIGF